MNRKERRVRIRKILKRLKNIDKHYQFAKDLPSDVMEEAYNLDNELIELSGKDFMSHVQKSS